MLHARFEKRRPIVPHTESSNRDVTAHTVGTPIRWNSATLCTFLIVSGTNLVALSSLEKTRGTFDARCFKATELTECSVTPQNDTKETRSELSKREGKSYQSIQALQLIQVIPLSQDLTRSLPPSQKAAGFRRPTVT